MITIRDSKGNQKMQVIENGSHQRKYELMVTDEVSLKFTSKEDISLNIGDYIDISEGRFYIIAEHQPTRNDTNGMYDYSPVFYDEIFLWKNKILKYSPIGGGAEASFSLTDSIGSHTKILSDNINSLGYDYSIEIDETVDDKQIELQYSNTSVYDAMIQIAQGFGCDCWKDGNVIYFGSCYKEDVSTWTYEEEIASLKPVRSKGDYASMVYPFGSSENLPASYKKALNLKVVNINGDNIKLNKAVTADMFGGERVYQPTETITIGNNLQYRLNGLYESGAIGELALQPSNYRVDLSNVKVYVDFVKDTQSGTQTGRYTNATVDLIVYANLSTGRQMISKTLLECTNESFISTALSGLSSVYITTNKLLKSISYSIEVKTDSTASDGYVLFSISNSSVSFQNQNYKLIAQTNIGAVELNSEYKPLEETAGWVKVLGSVPVIDALIKFEHEYSYNIPLGWYEDTNIGSVKTGVVQTNLSLPTIDGENEEDGFIITSDYIRIASVEPKYSVDKVVVFEQIKPNFTITDYRVESEEQTKKYENAEATYKFIQYMIDAPIMDGFSNKCILTSLGIQFQSGKLNGMSFEAAWQDNRLYIIPNTNYGRELPDYDLYPEDNDAFILTGIDVSFFSESAIAQAEQELVETTKEYLKKLFNEGLSYELKVRPAFAKDNNKVIGSLISLPNASEPVRIYGYTYPLAKPYSNYVYQLGNSAKYSALGSLHEYVAKSLNVPTSKPSSQKGVDTSDFVSKTKDETIKGHITIENNLDVVDDINVNNINAQGGVSAKGVADFGISSSNGGGSQIKVTPLVSDGQAIAQIEVDGKQNTLYAPNPDISGKVDKTEFNAYKQKVEGDVEQLSQSISTESNKREEQVDALQKSVNSEKALREESVTQLSKGIEAERTARETQDKLHSDEINRIGGYFDSEGNANNSNKLQGKTIAEILPPTGDNSRPIYVGSDSSPKEIDRLSVPGNIESMSGGVSAKGIADFGLNGGGGGKSNVQVKPLTNEGKPIAQITVDEDTKTIYAPDVDISGKVDKSAIGESIAPLDGNGIIPNAYLPSYVDDTIEVDTFDNLPQVGEGGKIYVVLDTDLTYRWSGSGYREISKSIALGETDQTAYMGSKGKKNAEDIAKLSQDLTNEVNARAEKDTLQDNATQQVKEDLANEANARVEQDQAHDTAIQALQDLFTEDGKAKNADKLDGKSIEELFDSLDANGAINITIGGVRKTLTKSELLTMLGFENTGKHNLPVYYEDEQMKEINSLSVPGNIESTYGGVSAKGIADFGTPSGTGGTGGISVLRDDEVANVTSEDVTQVASAYAVRKIRDIINIDLLPQFSIEESYVRGDVVVYNGEARQFTQDKAEGAWRSGITRPYDISAIATPLAIEKSWLKSVCEKQFGTILN